MAAIEATEPPPPTLAQAAQATQASAPSAPAADVAVGGVTLPVTQQIEELLTHLPLVEDAAQRGGDRLRSRLLDAAHLDAEVPRLDHHHRTLRLQLLFEERHDLLGDPLLQLRALGVELENARELRQAEDPVARDVGDVRMAIEGHQVMGAK